MPGFMRPMDDKVGAIPTHSQKIRTTEPFAKVMSRNNGTIYIVFKVFRCTAYSVSSRL